MIIVFTICITAKADLGWHLALEHNSSGGVVSGSVSALVTAINAGADVKVQLLDGSGNVIEIILPYVVSINVAYGVVSARYKTVSLEDLPSGNTRVGTNAYDIDAVFNSTGYVSYSRYNKAGGKISDSAYAWPLRWYVNY